MRRLCIRIVTRPLTMVQRFVTLSLLAHVLVTAAAIGLPGWRRGPQIPPNATVVELVGALPPAAAPRAKAPPAAPEPEPDKPNPTPKKPAKKPPPDAASLAPDKPAEAEPKPVENEPESEPDAEPERAGAAADETVVRDTAGSASAGASVSALDLGDSAFAWYRAAVANALYGNWRRPVVGGLREPLEVRVAFEIMRDGNIRGLRLDEPSGVPTLDRSALRAVTDATPLPPLPTHLREPYLPASIVFRLYPEGY